MYDCGAFKLGQYEQVPCLHFLGGSITARGVTPEIVLVGFLKNDMLKGIAKANKSFSIGAEIESYLNKLYYYKRVIKMDMIQFEKEKTARLEELLWKKARCELELKFNGKQNVLAQFQKLIKNIDKNIEEARTELYDGMPIADEIIDFVERKNKVYRWAYSNAKKELLDNERLCESCVYYNDFPNLSGELWCAMHPDFDLKEDYDKILKCRETNFEPLYCNKEEKNEGEISLMLDVIEKELAKYQNDK